MIRFQSLSTTKLFKYKSSVLDLRKQLDVSLKRRTRFRTQRLAGLGRFSRFILKQLQPSPSVQEFIVSVKALLSPNTEALKI